MSSTYNWIPATLTRNTLVNFKLAKYSAEGKFLGLVDAIDASIQLCGGAYSDGRLPFTFGTQYKKMVREKQTVKQVEMSFDKNHWTV
jgi:hypothetical protein